MSRQDEQRKTPDARAIYGDIIDREHHVSAKRPQMPRLSRAVQFAPYATLKGYDDLVCQFQWQQSEDSVAWTNIPDANEARLAVVTTEDNARDYWRVQVTIVDVEA